MDPKFKKLLLYIWNLSVDLWLLFKDYIAYSKDKIYCLFHKPPKVLSIQESIDLVINQKLSVSRYGDGEIKLVAGIHLPFQKCNDKLQKRLIEVLSSDSNNHLVCLSDVLSDLSLYNKPAQQHWKKHLAYYRKFWYKYLIKGKTYGNTLMTRCYQDLADKSPSQFYFESLKKIWYHKNILLIEGEKSRLGVGNDLFDNAKSIQRILAPNRNAFSHYESILKETYKYKPTDYLILLALGPTATILAYDLAQKGYQAIDIGHVDIEYEWFKMGATHKVPVPNKFVNEAGAGAGVGDIDNEKYLNEIVCRF